MTLARRTFLMATVAAVAAPALLRADQPVIRVAGLRTVMTIAPHFYTRFAPPGRRVEVMLFESPGDAKNAPATHSVDFGIFGVAAAVLGAAAGEPVVVIGGGGNRGMAVIAKADLPIATLRDLKGRAVAIMPGTTQEVFINERLRMEGMSIRDINPVRVSFSEMHAALARGDIDAYVGAEPGAGLSLATGIGKLVEYPYSTPMGALNVLTCAHAGVVDDQPDLARAFMLMHRQATEYAASHRAETIQMALDKLGVKREALEAAMPNIELTWRMDPSLIDGVKLYAAHMLALKQIRALPDFARFLDPRFSAAAA